LADEKIAAMRLEGQEEHERDAGFGKKEATKTKKQQQLTLATEKERKMKWNL
jgi:hypothetical protein